MTPLLAEGWKEYSIWDHSVATQELYVRRARREEPEMTCAAQAAELLAPFVRRGDTILDAGCGSGYFYHSLRARAIPGVYQGIDASPVMIRLGKQLMPHFGLSAEQLQLRRIEDLSGEVDHVVCMNVLSNIDNYHRPLERLLQCARRTLIMRESLHTESRYSYVVDHDLDPDVSLKTYVNTYAVADVLEFIRSYGYTADVVIDRFTGGEPQMVIGYPHYWTFVVAQKVV